MKQPLTLAIALAISITSAKAQATRKQIRIQAGRAAVLTNLVVRQTNCSMGAVPIPVVIEKPKHGVAQLAIAPVDLTATGDCPRQKSNVIAIIYAPERNFIGKDDVTFELISGNRTILISYELNVEAAL